jgi:hypothetical protein
MKGIALAVIVLAALAAGAFLAVGRDGAHANPDPVITVNGYDDFDSRDGQMTLREAMLLATGDLAVTALSQAECFRVSTAPWDNTLGCLSSDPPGASSADTIVFDTAIFPTGSPGTITLDSQPLLLPTGGDSVDGSGAGVIVDGGGGPSFPCFVIGSDNNSIKGLEIYHCSYGILIFGGSGNTVGGSSAAERNVISGNGYGVAIPADANTVKGNYIGTNAAGTIAMHNGTGVIIESGAQNNTIGGSSAAERNVISGNDIGVDIENAGTSGNTIKGNYIGTNAAGSAAVPNYYGVFIQSGTGNTIGGTQAGDGNVISGNSSLGVLISGAGTNGNTIEGNYVGTDAAGTAPLYNGTGGIAIEQAAADNTIGGTAPGEGNLIAFNVGPGVRVDGATTIGNRIRGNSIHSNHGKGIENANGGNAELAPPVITGFGSVMGTACLNCTIDVYSDLEDEYQGRVYEGSTTADGAGAWTFDGSPEGPNVTATATDAAGNTSEFSTPVAVPEATPTPTPTPTATPGATPTPPGGPTRTLQWGVGWNNATWSGSDGAAPQVAFACAAGKYAAAYRYVAGGLERFFPDRPDISNMTPLSKFDAFLILITQPVTCTMPVAAATGSSRTLQSGAGWNNAGWSGADATPPGDAFVCADGNYAAAYRYVAGGLERYFPGRPDISNMGPLNKYDAFLILATAPVTCTMPVGS